MSRDDVLDDLIYAYWRAVWLDDVPIVKPTRRRLMTPEECEEYGVPLGTEGPVDAGPDYAPGYLPDTEDR